MEGCCECGDESSGSRATKLVHVSVASNCVRETHQSAGAGPGFVGPRHFSSLGPLR
jgi:hypothetical protein